MGVKTLQKADTPSKNGYHGSQEAVQWSLDPRESRTHHSRRVKKIVKKGGNGSQDLREGGHTKADTLRKHQDPKTVHCMGKNAFGLVASIMCFSSFSLFSFWFLHWEGHGHQVTCMFKKSNHIHMYVQFVFCFSRMVLVFFLGGLGVVGCFAGRFRFAGL